MREEEYDYRDVIYEECQENDLYEVAPYLNLTNKSG